MKYGKIAQLRNILKSLKNYQNTGYLFSDVIPTLSDEQIREHEKKLRADNFSAPENVDILITELDNIISEYETGIDLEQIQYEWDLVRLKLINIFNEERVLPEILVNQIPSNE
jgi:hypothetical protein